MSTFLQESRSLASHFLKAISLLFGVAFILLVFPTDRSLTVMVMDRVRQDLVPAGVRLIVTDPLSAFLAQVQVAVLLAFIILFPLLLYGILRYFSPALYRHEKRVLAQVFFPAILLFVCGCVFAYAFLIPKTFALLYPCATAIGATPLFQVKDFLFLTFGLMVVSGVLFLLPVVMMLLNSLGIVGPGFWMKYWRHAFFGFLVFSAIITPDGTGITMLMLCVPFTAFYFLGAFLKIRK